MVEYGSVDKDEAMLAHVLWTLRPGRTGDDAKCLLLVLRLIRALIVKVLRGDAASGQTDALLLERLRDRLRDLVNSDLQASELALEGENLSPLDRPEAQRGPGLGTE